jgi:hypothetical protein
MSDMMAAQQGQQVDENGNPIPPEEGQPGQGPDQDGTGPEEADQAQMQQGGSELEQHLGTLDNLVNKAESLEDVKIALRSLGPSIRKITEASQSMALRKSVGAMRHLKRANFAAKKHSQSFHHNMDHGRKAAVTMQAKIVEDVMKAWNDQELEARGDILETLGVENKLK